MVRRWILKSAAAAVLASAAVACGGKDKPTEPSADALTSLLESVGGGASASFHAGSAPEAGNGPLATITGASSVAQGGTGQVSITASSNFDRVYVSSPDLDGYYEIALPQAVTEALLQLTFSTNMTGNQALNFQVGTNGGAVGAVAEHDVQLVDVITGDVQVTLSWNSSADIDLYVVDPDDNEIFFGNREVANGGQLDLDSNAGCGSDGPRAENITWNTTPPHGTYTVRVNNWSSCGEASTDWTITVRRRGQATQTFSGTYTGAGVGGGSGAGQVVTTFTY